MPLENAKVGTPGFGRNIATEIKAGKPRKQAVAIAYSKARDDASSIAYGYKVNGNTRGTYATQAEAAKKARDAKANYPGATITLFSYDTAGNGKETQLRMDAKADADFKEEDHPRGPGGKFGSGGGSAKPARQNAFKATNSSAASEIGYLKRQKASPDKVRAVAKRYEESANNYEKSNAKDLASWESGKPERPDLADPRKPEVRKHREKYVQDLREAAKELNQYAEHIGGSSEKDSAMKAGCVFARNGEYFFRHPGTTEHQGPFSTESEAIGAAIKAGAMDDADPEYNREAAVKMGVVADDNRTPQEKLAAAKRYYEQDLRSASSPAERAQIKEDFESFKRAMMKAGAKADAAQQRYYIQAFSKDGKKHIKDLTITASSEQAAIREAKSRMGSGLVGVKYSASRVDASSKRSDAASTIHQEGDEWVINVDHDGSETILRLDVRDYTEEEALEYATMLPQYTYGKFQTRVDSLPPLERALHMADSLYAKADAAAMSTYVVGYVNSVGKSGYIEVKAASRDEAQRKARKELGGECKRVFKVSEMASRADAESRSSLERRAKEKFEASERALRAKDYPLYNRLWDEAQDLVEKAQKARTDAERDLPGAGTGEGGYDDAQDPVEKAEGKLTKTEREGIGRPGSEEREDMPEGVFLKPGTKTYPVKEKKNGRWVYDRELLLAASRRARLNKDEALAAHADKIREREFESKADAERDLPGSGTTGSVGV